MNLKKGIISISTIAVVILGVFFAVRFIGGQENVASVKSQNDSVVQSDNSTAIQSNGVSNEDIQGVSSNEMDATYIDDKTNVGVYTVKENDTVFSIVKTYMPNHDQSEIVEFIKNRNSMNDSYKITKDQKIVIPYEKAIQTSKATVAQTSNIEYTVKKQDTLTSIAKNNMSSYNVKQAIDMLKQTNNITDENAIKIGSVINIPK
ncbi:MAG TPA: LysM domain-containing protein [Clostridium sp.]|uniref:LysM peptidoglycan-binding domain-containing protein n=1 Tax=Clostridium sp. TaxID=1506 RepID=UPI002F94B46F